jgi:1,4-alpha-glucan branching enzyme
MRSRKLLLLLHDEVVHGKQSMLHKMPGDEWRVRQPARFIPICSHPGKKLLFMGTEFGQGHEWDSTGVLDWWVLRYPVHAGVHRLVKDLNRLYHDSPELYAREFDWQGFEWIDCHDATQSVFSFLRRADDRFFAVIVNLTPVPRANYRIGLPAAGRYREIFLRRSSRR